MTAEEFERQVIAGEITDFEPYLNNQIKHVLNGATGYLKL